MKKLTFVAYPAIVALSLMAAVSAHAQQESMNLAPTGASAAGITRAQVQADLFKARADGSIKVWSSSYNPVLVTTSERSRDDVRAEAVAANRDGYGHIFYGEDSGALNLVRQQRQPAAPIYAGSAKRAQ
jgi:hypothetical protein